MDDLDPRKLLYFASVVEIGSLNRAARTLEISQPALSTSMDRLEQALGIKLLIRSPGGAVPTKLGEILYCHARLIREELKLAAVNLLNAQAGKIESVRIGALPSLAGGILPQALSLWRAKTPSADLQVVESAQIDLLTGLLRRDFDFVVGFTEVFDLLDGLRQQVLFRDVLCVLARPGHPLVGKSDLSWHDLIEFPWISPTSRRSHTVLEHVMSTIKVGPPTQVTVCGSVSLLKSLVAGSDHLALLPAHAASSELSQGLLVALPFHDPVLHRNIAVFVREGYELDPQRRELVNHIRDCGLKSCRALAPPPP